MTKTESRQTAAEFCPDGDKGKKSVGEAKSVFSQVTGLTATTNLFTEAAGKAANAVASATSNRERNLNPFGNDF